MPLALQQMQKQNQKLTLLMQMQLLDVIKLIKNVKFHMKNQELVYSLVEKNGNVLKIVSVKQVNGLQQLILFVNR